MEGSDHMPKAQRIKFFFSVGRLLYLSLDSDSEKDRISLDNWKMTGELKDPKLHYARARITERSDSEENNPEICSPNMIPQIIPNLPLADICFAKIGRIHMCICPGVLRTYVYVQNKRSRVSQGTWLSCAGTAVINTWLESHGLFIISAYSC
ncbi:hypothetical protein PCH_Pc12g01340 [Penicillium rubens Wisconsin 54-1255]|uniref:Uncharacterized protein n=1 Tax=Penicillium rubens (strain ATCC 28089 / DSM 1075 / NRRL 1951 / Wisconsin 54-1255) TaxID=500485 RepID=B6GYS3_PENRW|nr:hypothetical protein PCH_Pc12g01340 [Penicillium rubens Wisconsin 54-1255]